MSKLNSFYSENELSEIGFKKFGNNVFISRKASFYSPGEIVIGNNVRIDDFCILSGQIFLGDFIHISAYSALYGQNGIEMMNYTGLSPRCTIFSASDDFIGGYLIGPMVDQTKTNLIGGKVILQKFVQLGAGTIVLPNLTIGEGSVTGCLSFVNKNIDEWGVYIGIPAKFLKKRKKPSI